MSSVYDRHPSRPFGMRGRKRLALAIGTLVILAVAWRIIQTTVIESAAISSIGHPARAKLLAAALNRRYPQLPAPSDLWGDALSSRDAGHSHLLWFTGSQWAVADGALNLLGAVNTSGYRQPNVQIHGPRRDVFAIVTYEPLEGKSVWERWAVVRLCRETNELLAIVDVEQPSAPTRSWNQAAWRPDDSNGELNLVVSKYNTYTATGSGVWTGGPRRTLAELEWDTNAGVLRTKSLASDGSVRLWLPPEGQPERFPARELLSTVVARVQASYHEQQATSQPSSKPASAPTSP